MQIVKRSGEQVQFFTDKVVNAITKAMNETEKGIDFDLAFWIAKQIHSDYLEENVIPTVEEVSDRVEEFLANNGRFDASKRYILYRSERAKLREQGWSMTDLQKDIYEQKYRFGCETFDGFLDRISGGNEYTKKAIRNQTFLPAGRILAGRGLSEFGKSVTLSNCYVMPKIEDNLESIFDTAKWLARTYSYGGGCGVQISNLRPSGARVQNSAHTTTGATSFMDLYSMVTGLIGQKGRRGALMINMNVTHPDIEDFIDAKSYDSEKVRFANISVNMTDEFMRAVETDSLFTLKFDVESTGEQIRKVIKASDIFKKLALNNHSMAEPGVLFQDRINSWHLMSEDEDFEFAGVNPCAEEPLPAFGSCNLSSINLAKFVINPFTEEASFDYVAFDRAVKEGVIYLNEILDENIDYHPLEQQKQVSKDLRQIGLGIMGLADMFIKMGIRYGSDKSVAISSTIAQFMLNSALQQSALLAKEDGAFPLYKRDAVMSSPFLQINATDETLALIEMYGLRNSQVLTVAPTGSISTMVGVSGGMEPIFQNSYTRKSETLHTGDTYYKVFTPIVKAYMDANNLVDENDLPDFFVTSGKLDYKERIRVQSAWQQFIDASMSSTINVPNEFTVKEVEELYLYAWRMGLKGVTIYRDGCSRAGILTTNTKESRLNKLDELQFEMDKIIIESITENPDECPLCGGEMYHSGGCTECRDCAYSPCSI